MSNDERVGLLKWRERRKAESSARKPRNKAKYSREDYRKENQRELKHR